MLQWIEKSNRRIEQDSITGNINFINNKKKTVKVLRRFLSVLLVSSILFASAINSVKNKEKLNMSMGAKQNLNEILKYLLPKLLGWFAATTCMYIVY